MMKVVVTGAAGFLGSAVVRSLSTQGHEALGIVIEPGDLGIVERNGGTGFVGDLSTPEGLAVLRDLLGEADGVATCIKVCHRTSPGEVDPDTARREHLERLAGERWRDTNLACIETIVDVLRGTGKPFVYSNSAIIIGDMGETIADEETVPPHDSYYGSWLLKHEQMVLAASREGIRSVSLRAGMFYGPHPKDLPLGRPHPANMHQQLWEPGAVGYLDDGAAVSTGVHIDDYADLFVLALERAPAGSLFIGGAEDYTRQQLALALSYAYGYGGRTRSWTRQEAREVLGDGKIMKFLTENHRTTSAKAIRMLGWDPKAPSLVEYALQEARQRYGADAAELLGRN